MRNKSELEGMRENIDEYLEHEQEQPDAYEDLKAYVDKIEDLPKTKAQIIEEMERCDHAAFIKDIVYYLFMSPEDKTNCIFIHGAPNAGKT